MCNCCWSLSDIFYICFVVAGLWQVAKEEKAPEASFFVDRDLQRMVADEKEWRFRLWSQGK